MIGSFVSMVASVTFLMRNSFSADALAASATEVALVFGAVNLATGMIWARIIWGIWWAWDARLTFMLISWLMYAGYLMLRTAIEEPTQRARLSAVLSIFTFPGGGDYLESDRVVAHPASWSRAQYPTRGSRENGSGDGIRALPELPRGAAVCRRSTPHPHAAGRNAPRTRWFASGGARSLMDSRNFIYMFYGFAVAWVAVIVYVFTLVARERKLSEEMRRLRQMIESGDR